MFIVWGTKGFEKELGDTIIQDVCPHCSNEVRMQAKQAGRKFTLFWIPLFTISSCYYILCPICYHGKELNKNMIEQYLCPAAEEADVAN